MRGKSSQTGHTRRSNYKSKDIGRRKRSTRKVLFEALAISPQINITTMAEQMLKSAGDALANNKPILVLRQAIQKIISPEGFYIDPETKKCGTSKN